MEKKLIKGLKRAKLVNKDYADAINRLKEASMNSRITRKAKYEAIPTEKLLVSGGIESKHIRHTSQITRSGVGLDRHMGE